MRNLLAILLMAFIALSCQSPANEFTINGTISGVEAGKVYLLKIVDGKPKPIDSTDVAGGKFVFKGKMELPDLRILRLNQQDYFAQLFLDNAKVQIVANKDSLRNTKISGSPSQDIFQIYLAELERLNKEVAKLQSKYQNAMASGNADEAKKTEIDYTAMIDDMKVFTKNFVKEHNNSVVSAYIALVQLAPQLDGAELDSLVAKYPAEIGKSEYVIKLKEMAEALKKTAIGAIAPDFTMNDPEGKPVQLSSLRGKVVLIDFWASWCAPCRQENPNVVKIYKDYSSKGFEILGVSLDRDKEAWVKAIKDDQLNWLQVSDLQYWQNAAARMYSVNQIPDNYLLDKDGKIIAKGLRGDKLAAKLSELFPR